MFCPRCRYEYVEGVYKCPVCEIDLVDELPVQRLEYVNLVEVFSTGDPAVIMVAKSILKGAGIRYLAKGDDLQDLFALGRFGTGFNPLVGPVKFFVSGEDAEAAKGLLQELVD